MSRRRPPIGPIHSLRSMANGHSSLFLVGRRGYAGIDAPEDAGWADRLAYLQWFGTEMASALTIPGFVLALLGLMALVRTHRYFEAGSSALVFLGQSVLLVGLLGFDFDYFWADTIRPYSLVCYGLASLWLALGAESACNDCALHCVGTVRPGPRRRPRGWRA